MSYYQVSRAVLQKVAACRGSLPLFAAKEGAPRPAAAHTRACGPLRKKSRAAGNPNGRGRAATFGDSARATRPRLK